MLHLVIAMLCALDVTSQGPADPRRDIPAPPAKAAATAPNTVPALPTVVIVVDDDRAGIRLAAAIDAHLHGDVDLVVAKRDIAGLDLVAMDRLARNRAEREGAVAVFWVRPEGDAHTLYLAQPALGELRVRRVDIDPKEPAAGLEALGVIVRAATNAVLDQTPVGMDVQPSPQPPAGADDEDGSPDPPAPAPTRGRARVAVGYVGTTYAPEFPWLSGMELAAAWVWPFGLVAGVDATIHPRARINVPEGRVEVTRHPWAGRVGYDRRFENLWVGADFGVLLDYPVRRATSNDRQLIASTDRGRLSTGLAAGLRLGVVSIWRLELFVAPRAELWLSQTRYGIIGADGLTRVVADPRRLRATVAIGVAARL